MSHANGAMPQPVALIQIALFADGNVAAKVDGQVNELTIRGMCGTGEALLADVVKKKMAEKRGDGIEVPAAEVARKLLEG